MVAYDTDMAGPMGYYADISRTYLCGDGRPTQEQLESYKFAYNFIYESMPLFRPGMNFREIAEKCPAYPEEFKDNRYGCIAHGDGMCNEWPSIFWYDHSWSGYESDSDVLEENMVLSVEDWPARPGPGSA